MNNIQFELPGNHCMFLQLIIFLITQASIRKSYTHLLRAIYYTLPCIVMCKKWTNTCDLTQACARQTCKFIEYMSYI